MTEARAGELARDRRQLIADYSAAARLFFADGVRTAAITECVFQRMADCGVFSRRHPEFAITAADCSVA